MLCKVNGFGVVTDCRVVARFKAFAKINLNGRQSQWTQWSERWEGPALRASHGWKCVDDNGNLPNSSCQDLMHRKNSGYTIGRYVAPDPHTNYHSDDELYWYKFHYHFEIDGYSGKWRWPNGGEFDSAKFECLDAFEPSPCRFY